MHPLRAWALRAASRRLTRWLETADTESLLHQSARRAVAAFRRAADEMPVYPQLLREAGVDPTTVRDLSALHRHVPVLDKQAVFGRFPLPSLCARGDLAPIKTLLVSSGTSGTFAFGLKNAAELRRNARDTDVVLETLFAITRRKSFLINGMPMGARVYSGLPMSDVGPHPQRVIALVKAVGPHVQQILIAGLGHLFFKGLVEEGGAQGLGWDTPPVYFLTGGEHLPENARAYIAGRRQEGDPKATPPKVIASAGVTELYLNALFQETPETIRVRQLAHRHAALRQALFGPDISACPMLFVWNPLLSYVEILYEEEGVGEIVVTSLDRTAAVPLVRYNTHDRGRVLHPTAVANMMADHGFGQDAPRLPLPWMAFYGRWDRQTPPLLRRMDQDVQEALYADPEVAHKLTGNFQIIADPTGAIRALVQLAREVSATPALREQLTACVKTYVHAPLIVDLHPFDGFPAGMGLDFENKFQYTQENWPAKR